jgi:hypothetical protein
MYFHSGLPETKLATFYMPRYFISIAAIVLSAKLFAQHKTVHVNMLWFNYNNTVELNSKWSVVNDVQLRTRDWAKQWSVGAVRSGVSYRINNKFAVAAGFTWFGNMRYISDTAVLANEWRPWQEASLQLHTGKGLLVQRIRTEERFLQKLSGTAKTNNFEKRFRVRYRIEYTLPPINKKIELHAGNEVMVNMNYINDNRFFDQNRLFALINYKTSPSTFVQFQFIKLFQWQAAANTMEDQNVFRFSVHQFFSYKK